MKLWHLAVALALAVVAVLAAKREALWAMLTASNTATALGISNEPTTAEDRARLEWLTPRLGEVLAVVQEKFPAARVTSAYRNDAVNAAVGGVATSRHRRGLAFDLGWGVAEYTQAAQWLRSQAHRLSVPPKSVIAETSPPHLHIEYFDPLQRLDSGAGATAWLYEPGADNRWQSLPA